MALVTTVSPTFKERDHIPGIPDDGDGNIAGEFDLSTLQAWTFLSSFVSDGLSLSNYSSSTPSIDIGAGRVSRHEVDEQKLVQVDAAGTVSLASDATNYLFFRGDNVIEVRDADEPPSADALLFGKIDTAEEIVTEDVRGRSPVPSDAVSSVVSASVSGLVDAFLESEDMANGTTRYTRERLSDSEKLQVQRAGVIADSLSAATDLEARVITESGPTTEHATTAKREVGDPIVSVEGPADVRFELSNATGSTQTGVSGRWSYKIVSFTPPPVTWPQWRATDRHTGTIDSTAPTSSPTEQWRVNVGANSESSPAVVEGTVYVGGSDGNVYAIDASDGTEQWSYTATDAVSSSPAVVDGSVYVGDESGVVHAINASDGTEKWTYTTPSGVFLTSSPAVVDGTVYIGGGAVHALAASDGTEEWTFTAGGFAFTSSPAVADGAVYIGCNDNNLYSLATSDGSENWSFAASNAIASSPSVVDGTVFVGDNGPNFYAITASSGAEDWSYTFDSGPVQSSPAVADGTVYVGADSGEIAAFTASDGTVEWRTKDYNRYFEIASSPAVVDGTVYIGTVGYETVAFDAANGTELWVHDTGNSLGTNAPAPVGGVVYMSDYSGVFALE